MSTPPQPPEDGDEPFRLRDIGASIYLPSLLFGIGQGAVAPVIIVTATELGASPAIAFLVFAIAAASATFANLPAGQIVARIGERRAMHLGAALAVITFIGCAFAPNVPVFAVAIGASGLSAAIWALARHLYLTDAVPYAMRSRAMATLGGVHRAGTFVGPFAAAGVMALLGTDGAYWLHVVAAVLASGVLLVVRDPTLASTSGSPGTTVRGTFAMIRDELPVLRTVGVCAMLVNVVRAARMSVLPLWALEVGLDPATVSLVVGISGAADLLLFYPAGVAMDRWGRRWISAVAMVVLALAFFALPFTDSLATVVTVGVLMGIGNGLTTGLVLTLSADAAPEHRRGEFLGAFRVWAESGSFVGPLAVSGVAALAALTPAVVVMGVVAAGAVLASARWIPPMRREAG